jgi:hypothetical protein
MEQPAEPAAPQGQPFPATLTIPAGTILVTRINDYLSTDHNKIGDQFTATLENPIVVNGWVVARRGQTIVGKVKEVRKAGRVKGTSELGVELTDLSVVDGRQLPILTELWKGSGGTSHGQDAATIGTSTGLGALIGAAADWGTGAAIGAGAGAAAGIGLVLLTRGRPTVIGPEAQLSFRLVDPVTVDTTQSQQAFLPVNQRDFEDRIQAPARMPILAVIMAPAIPTMGIQHMSAFTVAGDRVTTTAAFATTEPLEFPSQKTCNRQSACSVNRHGAAVL